MNIGVLVSGNGSNLQALIDGTTRAGSAAKIVCVVSNKTDAYALTRARDAGISAIVVRPRDFPDRESYDREVLRQLLAHGVEAVCLAGYMRLLTPDFTAFWGDRILNIHPSLLPSFKGLDAIGQALAAGVAITGCTVHIVRPEMDSGPVAIQAAVPVHPGDTAATLAERVHAAEHRIYPLAMQWMAEGRIRVAGERVQLDLPVDTGAGVLVSPLPV